MAKVAVRCTALWLHLWFYIIQGFTNALWKKSLTMAKCGMNIFWLSSIIPYWQKPLWTVCAFVNWKKASIFSFFNGQMWTKCAVNILRSYLNWWHNWQLKSSRRSHTLKGSHSMGDRRIFLKTRPDVSFKVPRLNRSSFVHNFCRDPSRHFFFQSRWLLTKILKSEVIGNWKCRCCEVKGEGNKTGVAERVICLSPP